MVQPDQHERMRVLSFVTYSILLLFFYAAFPEHVAGQEFARTDTVLDVTHYDLQISPDIQSKMLTGACRVTYTTTRTPLTNLTLDARDMEILDVRIDGRGVSGQKYDSLTLYIPFEEPLLPGDTMVAMIRYQTIPPKGMYFIAPDASFPAAPVQFWTHNEPCDARYWFPCHDVPWDKASCTITVTTDASLRVVANGRMLEERSEQSGLRTTVWTMAHPVSTYLIAVAGGMFDEYHEKSGDIPVSSWYPKGTTQDIIEAAYGATPEMIDFFAAYTHTPYPWNSYTQVPLRNFPYGGMENVTLTFLSDKDVLFDMRARENYSDQPLVSHELAHQWWGDLVTCQDWEDLWINEGYATYFQQLWTRESVGRDEYDYMRWQGVENVLTYLDGKKPLTVRAHQKNAPQNLYSKGAAILSLYSDMVGEDAFRRACRELLDTYAYKPLSTRQLQEVFEKYVHRGLERFFAQWLDRADYPIVTIEKKWDDEAKTLAIHIHQRCSSGDSSYAFELPLQFYVEGQPELVSVFCTSHDTTVTVRTGTRPAYITMNRIILARMDIKQSPEELRAIATSAQDVPSRIVAVKKLMQHVSESPYRKALFSIAESDSFYGVRFMVATELSRLNPDTVDFRKELAALFTRLVKDAHASVRATALNGLSKMQDAAFISLFRTALHDPSYHVEAAAMNCLLGLHPADSVDILSERLQKTSYKDILALAALPWVGPSAIEALGDTIARLAMPGNSIALRYQALQILLQFPYPDAELFPLLRGMLQEPLKEIRYFSLSGIAARFAQQAPEIFSAHLADEPDEQLREAVQQYLNAVHGNGRENRVGK